MIITEFLAVSCMALQIMLTLLYDNAQSISFFLAYQLSKQSITCLSLSRSIISASNSVAKPNFSGVHMAYQIEIELRINIMIFLMFFDIM